MWLLNVSTRKLESFEGNKIPEYVILSHRWEEEEVSLRDIKHGSPQEMKRYRKIDLCCQQAESEGLSYAWVDTCCIDKKSSVELSEAIDTLISSITPAALINFNPSEYSIFELMSWAKKRETTREEDQAYSWKIKHTACGINMPMLYGEGQTAFKRLQEEIMKISDDRSILLWTPVSHLVRSSPGALAESPKDFRKIPSLSLAATGVFPHISSAPSMKLIDIQNFMFTAAGLYIRAEAVATFGNIFAIALGRAVNGLRSQYWIFVQQETRRWGKARRFRRVSIDGMNAYYSGVWEWTMQFPWLVLETSSVNKDLSVCFTRLPLHEVSSNEKLRFEYVFDWCGQGFGFSGRSHIRESESAEDLRQSGCLEIPLCNAHSIFAYLYCLDARWPQPTILWFGFDEASKWIAILETFPQGKAQVVADFFGLPDGGCGARSMASTLDWEKARGLSELIRQKLTDNQSSPAVVTATAQDQDQEATTIPPEEVVRVDLFRSEGPWSEAFSNAMIIVDLRDPDLYEDLGTFREASVFEIRIHGNSSGLSFNSQCKSWTTAVPPFGTCSKYHISDLSTCIDLIKSGKHS